ncbi:Cytochrome c oxidase biogenesis protein Cmc1-like [Dillenia turbinata]|uniref:COX assembly mitochondrial protein n=1 Tax=Dillenia turbinata TaxID=194707 RepID=A0AAN8UN83_9MAGN
MGYIQAARDNHVKKKVEEEWLKEEDISISRATCVLSCIVCVIIARDSLELSEDLDYSECATGRTLSVVWKCHGQAKELNNCFHQYYISAYEIDQIMFLLPWMIKLKQAID